MKNIVKREVPEVLKNFKIQERLCAGVNLFKIFNFCAFSFFAFLLALPTLIVTVYGGYAIGGEYHAMFILVYSGLLVDAILIFYYLNYKASYSRVETLNRKYFVTHYDEYYYLYGTGQFQELAGRSYYNLNPIFGYNKKPFTDITYVYLFKALLRLNSTADYKLTSNIISEVQKSYEFEFSFSPILSFIKVEIELENENYDKAEWIGKLAINDFKKKKGHFVGSQETSYFYSLYARALFAVGSYDDGEKYIDMALSNRSMKYYSTATETYYNLAWCYKSSGNSEKSKMYLEKMLERSKYGLGKKLYSKFNPVQVDSHQGSVEKRTVF